MWEGWAPNHWDSAMQVTFAEGRGCPDCASLDDKEAADRFEASLRREAESSLQGSDVEQTPGVSSVLRGLGASWMLLEELRYSWFHWGRRTFTDTSTLSPPSLGFSRGSHRALS
jgi:hypothetical protein